MAKQTKRVKARIGDTVAPMGFAEAIAAVKTNATAKFDESIEIAVNLGVDPRHADQQVRGVVNLPSGTGRDVRVAVFAKDAKAAEALAAGADVVGAEDLYEKINGGFMDFDRVIASPDMMALVGRLGKVLGPRGLMPNPKVGTVTPNAAQASLTQGARSSSASRAGIATAASAGPSPGALEANVQPIWSPEKAFRPAPVHHVSASPCPRPWDRLQIDPGVVA